jgi:hypothetical protein
MQTSLQSNPVSTERGTRDRYLAEAGHEVAACGVDGGGGKFHGVAANELESEARLAVWRRDGVVAVAPRAFAPA